VTHSQGGLIVQRFLSWMLLEGRGRDLAWIRLIVMLACPNEGSEYLRSIRAVAGFGRHPQAKALRVLDTDVGEARRIVLRQIINAPVLDERNCRIPFYVYSGDSDNVVSRESAQSVFPRNGVLPGDHFSILNPDAPGNLTLPVLKRHLLGKIGERAAAPSRSGAATESSLSQEKVGTQSEMIATLTFDDPWMRYADVDHEQLFGIDNILERLGRLVVNDNGDWIISIFGEGGAGKTTLAYEMVKCYAASAGFDRVAWVSAKFSHMRALGRLEQSRHTAISWHDLLLDISRQLGLDIELNPARIEDRLAAALRILDPADRCLIVIDNLETLADAERAVAYLARSSVLKPHKVVITTRNSTEKLSSLVREVVWHGLENRPAREFARYLAADVPNFNLTAHDFDQVFAASVGIPLLIKMIVRLAVVEARPVAEVVGQLKDPKGELGERVGHYLYEQSMNALAAKVGYEAAAGLINVFCSRVSGESFSREEFYELSLIEDRETFERARIVARDLALVRALDGNSRFTVHPLLREFVCGDGDSAGDLELL
jgi:hypothetical protein